MNATIFLVVLLINYAAASTGSVHIRGRLLCNGRPYAREKIQIWEKNFALADTMLIHAVTDNDGYFDLQGSITETMMSPLLYAYFVNYCKPSFNWLRVKCDLRPPRN
ncbi:Transthyretin-like family protein [Caenorhabditis elegans]|uniref:Transthyretin-like family protein n=1 Tax=Caenorhabditis elegans TaxID=6239 RepID=Q9XV15_CAEEL|nr:Transthyretin-like family protein [Caenorhabditis elegans]CAB04404.3 Transthyretin-like family protein [Caenorhabditis elegans]|eukprot:NP_507975.3 TransThyretin-Related family domain [Caenorhabditis elegans]